MDAVKLARRAVSGMTSTATATATASSSTSEQLSFQWANPSNVLSILLIIGGDIVHKALANTAGGPLAPVCFSFGWVAYVFTALMGVMGDGHLLPAPDYAAKVINLKNGYARKNRNWVIGRLLRDNETRMARFQSLSGRGGGSSSSSGGGGGGGDVYSLRISVYQALPCERRLAVAGSGVVAAVSAVVVLLQLGIAAIPAALYSEWGVLMITAAGTVLALQAGALPQWSVEKLPSQRKSRQNVAVTSGHGSRDIMIVLGCEQSLDLEEMAALESPRSARLWRNHPLLSWPVKPKLRSIKEELREFRDVREALMYRGLPVGFWITCAMCTIQCILWLALLITAAGLQSNAWFLIAAAGLGMFQNTALAAISRDPEKRNLPLCLVDDDVIQTYRVMDGLMDLEVTYPGFAWHLVKEFYPRGLRVDEVKWWNGERGPYDRIRFNQKELRGHPRSMMPNYASISTPNLITREKPLSETVTAAAADLADSNSHTLNSNNKKNNYNNTTTVPPAPKADTAPLHVQSQETPPPADPSTTGPSAATAGAGAATFRTGSAPPYPKRPDVRVGVSVHDFEPALPDRKDTDNTNSSKSTTLSVDEVYSIIQTPPWSR